MWHHDGCNETIKTQNFIISEIQFIVSLSVPLDWLFTFWGGTAMHRNTLRGALLHCPSATPHWAKFRGDTHIDTETQDLTPAGCLLLLFFYSLFFSSSFPSPPALLLLLLFLFLPLSIGKNIHNSPKNGAAGLLLSITSMITSEANVQGPL